MDAKTLGNAAKEMRSRCEKSTFKEIRVWFERFGDKSRRRLIVRLVRLLAVEVQIPVVRLGWIGIFSGDFTFPVLIFLDHVGLDVTTGQGKPELASRARLVL